MSEAFYFLPRGLGIEEDENDLHEKWDQPLRETTRQNVNTQQNELSKSLPSYSAYPVEQKSRFSSIGPDRYAEKVRKQRDRESLSQDMTLHPIRGKRMKERLTLPSNAGIKIIPVPGVSTSSVSDAASFSSITVDAPVVSSHARYNRAQRPSRAQSETLYIHPLQQVKKRDGGMRRGFGQGRKSRTRRGSYSDPPEATESHKGRKKRAKKRESILKNSDIPRESLRKNDSDLVAAIPINKSSIRDTKSGIVLTESNVTNSFSAVFNPEDADEEVKEKVKEMKSATEGEESTLPHMKSRKSRSRRRQRRKASKQFESKARENETEVETNGEFSGLLRSLYDWTGHITRVTAHRLFSAHYQAFSDMWKFPCMLFICLYFYVIPSLSSSLIYPLFSLLGICACFIAILNYVSHDTVTYETSSHQNLNDHPKHSSMHEIGSHVQRQSSKHNSLFYILGLPVLVPYIHAFSFLPLNGCYRLVCAEVFAEQWYDLDSTDGLHPYTTLTICGVVSYFQGHQLLLQWFFLIELCSRHYQLMMVREHQERRVARSQRIKQVVQGIK